MRILKIMLITFILGGLLAVPGLGCTSESESAVLENQTVTVRPGDLTIDVTAAGNLALSRTEDLTFGIEGTVQEVLKVKEVMVQEGDVVKEGQPLAKLDTTALERAIELAEIDLEIAEYTLMQTAGLTPPGMEAVEVSPNYTNIWGTDLPGVSSDLQQMDRLLAEIKRLLDVGEIDEAQAQLKQVQDKITDAQYKVRGKNYRYPLSVKLDELQVDKARIALDEAKGNLQKAVIPAPFDGFVTQINVCSGDEVTKGTVVMQLADSNKFEAEVAISEMDILQVKLGDEAWVQVDAMQGINLPAKVTHISPTATIESGVVNYKVKVEPQEQQEVQEGQQGQVPTMLPEDFQLREGLTVTVSIIVEERSDVLLVPNGAITSQGGQAYVQVVSPDGTIEERLIQTGISNWQYTEVIDGLIEGEKVVVPQGTTTTSTTEQSPPGGIMRMPGIGPSPHD